VWAWLALANTAIARRPGWFVAAFVVLYGLGFMDLAGFGQLARHPLTLNPDVEHQFLHSSPLPFFVGYPLARWIDPAVAYAVVVVVGLGGLGWAFLRLVRQLPAGAATTVSLVLLSSPLLLVLTGWIGKSDPMIVGLYLLLIAGPRSPWCRGALAAAIVLCHREIGSFVLIGHTAVHRRDPAVWIGFVIGHLGVFGYLHGLLPAAPGSRAEYAEGHTAALVGGLAANPVAHLVLSFGWFWIFAAIHARFTGRISSLAWLSMVVGIASVTLDFTRVAVMCALPVIVDTALWFGAAPDRLPRFVRRLPFPLVFLIQFQLSNAHQLRDSRWLDEVVTTVAAE
jgi:hypothetical protein